MIESISKLVNEEEMIYKEIDEINNMIIGLKRKINMKHKDLKRIHYIILKECFNHKVCCNCKIKNATSETDFVLCSECYQEEIDACVEEK